jgi:glycyl-tRNA synthetase beta chain
MATLLLEIGVEELPASACREALAQLPELTRAQLGADPTAVYVGPRRLTVVVDDLPDPSATRWLKGPPVSAPDKAREGFARRHGVAPGELEEQDGFLGVRVPGPALGERLQKLVEGLTFGKSMVWITGGPRFSRPVRWLLAKHDSETVEFEAAAVRSGTTTFGHRFTAHELEIPDAGAYLGLLRNAGVEPDHEKRRRRILAGLDAIGAWSDPGGKLEEVVHLVESVTVIPGSFHERFRQLPERVVVTAMQSHQRYFPLGGNRFAFVANGGDPDVVRAGNEQVLEGRLDDAEFTFERDRAKGIDALAERLGAITFFQGAGTLAEKTERVMQLVTVLGGGDAAREAARLAKADQASELVREFADLEGYIGAEYARLAGYPELVCKAIEEQYLPDSSGGPLPSTGAGLALAAADKLDTLTIAFSLGHRPTGSRDPYGLRRAAIGLNRIAVEGKLRIERGLLEPELRDFVEERLEGLLDVPVEFVRAARASGVEDLASVAALARHLAALPEDRLAPVHEVYTRAARISGPADDAALRPELIAEPSEQALADALGGLETEKVRLGDYDGAFDSAAALAPVVERFFVDVLVMAEDSEVRANRLRLLRDVKHKVGMLGDFAQIPL